MSFWRFGIIGITEKLRVIKELALPILTNVVVNLSRIVDGKLHKRFPET